VVKHNAVIRRSFAGWLALAFTSPTRALSLERATAELMVRFPTGSAALSDSQRDMLTRQLPRIRMIWLDSIWIEACFLQAGGRSLPTLSLAKKRVQVIGDLFVRAGIPTQRVAMLTRAVDPVPALGAQPIDDVLINWAGQCLPDAPRCLEEYFPATQSRSSSGAAGISAPGPEPGASRPAQSPPAKSP
jgi:hypothetical protein